MVYTPPAEFKQDGRDPLIDLNLTDSTELFLIQLPMSHPLDFDGQEISLKFDSEGHWLSFEGSSGKTHEVVTHSSRNQDSFVFQSSASESKIVGKISQRVCFVHRSDPSEVPKQKFHKQKLYEKSGATSFTNSAYPFGTPNNQGTRGRQTHSGSGYAGASTHSSRRKSSLSELGEPSTAQPTRPITHDSGLTHSGVVSSASLGHSHEKGSKKKKIH